MGQGWEHRSAGHALLISNTLPVQMEKQKKP